jgi:hypothetical protein
VHGKNKIVINFIVIIFYPYAFQVFFKKFNSGFLKKIFGGGRVYRFIYKISVGEQRYKKPAEHYKKKSVDLLILSLYKIPSELRITDGILLVD